MSVDIHIYKFEKLSAAELDKVKYFNVSDDERLLGDGHNWTNLTRILSCGFI